jgi:hypothetical protein
MTKASNSSIISVDLSDIKNFHICFGFCAGGGVHGVKGLVFGIESPGLTSSSAIAEYIISSS